MLEVSKTRNSNGASSKPYTATRSSLMSVCCRGTSSQGSTSTGPRGCDSGSAFLLDVCYSGGETQFSGDVGG